MNHNEELQKANKELDEIERLRATVQERIKRLQEPPGRWRAAPNTAYWLVSSRGAVGMAADVFMGSDDLRYAIGNYFRTEEEAEAFAEVFRKMVKTPPDYRMGEIIESINVNNEWIQEMWRGSPRQVALHYMDGTRKR